MTLLEQATATAEFLVVDTETNGLGGEACELTEVGAVLVGGGELHDRWSSFVRCNRPLGRGIQRFTGITQEMLADAPGLEEVLPTLAEWLDGRVLVAHNAPFDRRVLRRAFELIGFEWPNPPVLCTAALARKLLPLQNRRGLTVLADALGIEVETAHRALADAETCARVLCALFPRLCANALTIADAIALTKPRRRRAVGRKYKVSAGTMPPQLDFADLPQDPGVYLFRDDTGRVLYVGKSISIRSRARAHFAPSSLPASWTTQATLVDYQSTNSELGALVLENRLIKRHKPPGNIRLTRRDERLCYIRCRLDIPFPILEVASEPAAGHAVTIGPLTGRRLARELVEQLDSLFGLRHCGRRLKLREHPSVYGQMGRCLSPCLGDLDPNLYRRRLDEALRLFVAETDGRERLLSHVRNQMSAAADQQLYERAAWLRRRLRRLGVVLERLGGALEATHVRAKLILAPHPVDENRHDAFWLVRGRLVDWGPAPDDSAVLEERTEFAIRRGGRAGELGAHVPPDEIDELRIIATYLASHPELPEVMLERRELDEAAARARRPTGLSRGAAPSVVRG